MPSGVEPRHRRGQGLTQLERGQRHGLAGIVLEEPELEASPDLGIGLEAVVHLRPADHARLRAVHEDDGDQPGPVRRDRDERRPRDPGEPAQEPEELELPDRHVGEGQRERRRGLHLERDQLAGDRDRLRVPGQVELERGGERASLDEGPPDPGDPQEGRHRDLEARRHQVPARSRGIDGSSGGGEREAEARPPVPHRQTVHLQLPRRREPVQLTVSGPQAGRIEGHLDGSEGQGERAAPGDDLRTVLGREGAGERQVVEVRRDPEARVETPEGRPGSLGEQEGVRIDGRGQVVVGFVVACPWRKESSARANRRPGPPRTRPWRGGAPQWRLPGCVSKVSSRSCSAR